MAKATVEVGLVIAVLITHVTAARRRASRRVDGAASVGVVIITSAAARCIRASNGAIGPPNPAGGAFVWLI